MIGEAVNSCIEEEFIQFRVEFMIFHGHFEDAERAVRCNRLFVGPVRGGERIENIANRHDLCLHRNFIASQFVRITRPVQLLMVRSNDSGNFADLLGPGNLKQKIEAVNHVRFNLGALIRAETPFRNGKIADLFRRKNRLFHAARIMIGLPRDFKQTIKFSFGEHGWLIRLQHGLEAAFHLEFTPPVFLFQRSNTG
jgi:hypothetical protein